MTAPVQLSGFTKHYRRNWFLRHIGRLFRISTRVVRAVDDFSLTATKGQITVLVGINGCGKTTTLAAVAGLCDVTDGKISLDGTGGIGMCPQKVSLS
jgi:ABC-type Fe3+/spermidine/putrescine transport system ATPase subunit